LVKEVDVSLLDSSPHGGIFGFLLLKKDVGAPPTAFLSKKRTWDNAFEPIFLFFEVFATLHLH
jgi:hypothetical protein